MDDTGRYPLETAARIAAQHEFQTPIDEEDAAARVVAPVLEGVMGAAPAGCGGGSGGRGEGVMGAAPGGSGGGSGGGGAGGEGAGGYGPVSSRSFGHSHHVYEVLYGHSHQMAWMILGLTGREAAGGAGSGTTTTTPPFGKFFKDYRESEW